MAEMTERKQQKLMRRGRGRGWKNLLWYLFGFLTPILLVAGGLAIGIFALPVSTYTGGNPDYFIPEIANGTIWNFVQNYSKYTVGDLPILEKTIRETIEKNDLDKYVEVDYDAINSIPLNSSAFENFDINNYVTIVASIRTLNLEKELGDFGKLSSFRDWEVCPAENVDPSDPNFVPQLYYYEVSGSSSYSTVTSGPTKQNRPVVVDGHSYERAFDDNKNLVPGFVAPYYYPALMDLPITEMTQVIGARIGTTSATSLFEVVGIPADSMLGKIVAGRTLEGLGKITSADIKLSDFLDLSTNTTLKAILQDVTGVEDANDITLHDLEGEFDTNAIRLETFLPEADNQTFYDIIRGAKAMEPGETVTVGSINGLNFDLVKISAIIKVNDDSADLYRILSSCLDGKAAEEITVGDLGHIDPNNAKIKDLMKDVHEDDVVAKILVQACYRLDEFDNKYSVTWDELTLDDLTRFDSERVKLETVTTFDEATLKILIEGSNYTGPSYDFTLGDISHFTVDRVKLTSVLKEGPENEKLFDIFRDVFIGTTPSGHETPITDLNQVTVGDFESFDINHAHLATIMPIAENETLYKVLSDATGVESANITVGTLAAGISFDDVKLTSILNYSSNVKMFDILMDCVGVGDPDLVTIGALSGFNTNGLHLSKVLDPAANANLYLILVDAVGKSAEEITIGDFTGFNIGNVKLNSVLTSDTGNPILDQLRNDNTVTISNIADKFDNVKLYDAYGKDCFTTNSALSVRGDTYRKEGDHYILDAGGEYYVSKTASTWLIFCYDAITINPVNGRVEEFAPSAATFSTLADGSIASKITASTIHTLVVAGIIAEDPGNPYKDAVTKMTIDGIITYVNTFII